MTNQWGTKIHNWNSFFPLSLECLFLFLFLFLSLYYVRRGIRTHNIILDRTSNGKERGKTQPLSLVCPTHIIAPLSPLSLLTWSLEKSDCQQSRDHMVFRSSCTHTRDITRVLTSGVYQRNSSFIQNIHSKLVRTNRGKLDSKKQFSYGWEKQLRV